MPPASRMTFERWQALMRAWAFEDNRDTFDALVAAYSGRGRHYHTAEHVSACLGHLDAHADALDAPQEVELALWFHDAVYRRLSERNERDSAQWAASFMASCGARGPGVERVTGLVLVTEHRGTPRTRDEAALVDIDLSILGTAPPVYANFEKAVRKEFWFVPDFIYRRKRADILRGFLGRPRIFGSGVFPDEREVRARENLSAAVLALTGTR